LEPILFFISLFLYFFISLFLYFFIYLLKIKNKRNNRMQIVGGGWRVDGRFETPAETGDFFLVAALLLKKHVCV